MEVIAWILFIAYIIAGWWAVNVVWYSKRVYVVHDTIKFYAGKLFLAVFVGWFCIPIAIIMKLIGK